MTSISAPTPLRATAADLELDDGVWLLGRTDLSYVEPAEVTVMEILRQATDVSSMSAELDLAGEGSAVTYHLSSQRANVVRFLDLPPRARVLEIGSGCGAVTRYLGESCAVVDAVEPMARRAKVARERCRDLPSVEVFAGEVDDVPLEPAYDVVLVNGVLEYVGNGAADPADGIAFLAAIAARLRPGGTLIVAIENALGVKYVVGAPEDHTDREFDSLEGYPRPNHARVRSRRGLLAMLASAGFDHTRVLGAFPDYKRTKVLIDDSIADVDPSLAYRIPPFPSPDRRGYRHRVADEFSVWRTLVDAGLGSEFPNSFVALARQGEGTALWPDGRHAVFARNLRKPQFAVTTVLETVAGQARFRRESPTAGALDGVRLSSVSQAFVAGTEMLDEIIAADDTRMTALMVAWSDAVEGADFTDGAPLDLLPHNMIVTPEGALVLIDDEYRATGWSRHDVRCRGVLTLALKLSAATSASRWGQPTVGDLAQGLGTMVGLSGDWLEGALVREAALRRTVRPLSAVDTEAELRAALATPLVDGPLDLQAIRRLARADAELVELRERAEVSERALGELRSGLAHRVISWYRRRRG